MKRGTVVWVNLSDANPPEMNKLRPAVIISNSIQNLMLNTVVVVPLSSQKPEIWPLRIKLNVPQSRTSSFAIVPGVRQSSKGRLQKEIGLLDEKSMSELDRAVRAYLSD